MAWAVYKDSIDRTITKKKWITFVISGFAFSVIFIGALLLPVFQIQVKMVSAVAFAIFVTDATLVLPNVIYNNPLTRIIGKYSLEIYVCQGFFLLLRKDGVIYIENPYVFIGVALIGTAILSLFMKPIYAKITNTVRKL